MFIYLFSHKKKKSCLFLDFLNYICILSGMGGQNNKVTSKIFKLFRIIPKKYIINFFKKFWGGGGGKARFSPCDGPPLGKKKLSNATFLQ